MLWPAAPSAEPCSEGGSLQGALGRGGGPRVRPGAPRCAGAGQGLGRRGGGWGGWERATLMPPLPPLSLAPDKHHCTFDASPTLSLCPVGSVEAPLVPRGLAGRVSLSPPGAAAVSLLVAESGALEAPEAEGGWCVGARQEACAVAVAPIAGEWGGGWGVPRKGSRRRDGPVQRLGLGRFAAGPC